MTSAMFYHMFRVQKFFSINKWSMWFIRRNKRKRWTFRSQIFFLIAFVCFGGISLHILVYESLVSIKTLNVSGKINFLNQYYFQSRDANENKERKGQVNNTKVQRDSKVVVDMKFPNKSMESNLTYQNTSVRATSIPYLKTPLLSRVRCADKYKLLIMVTTIPESLYWRNNIRDTWANKWLNRTDLPKWKTMFQMGQSTKEEVRLDVERESQKYNDIILGNFTDNFYNLPIKVIMAFEWALQFCKF